MIHGIMMTGLLTHESMFLNRNKGLIITDSDTIMKKREIQSPQLCATVQDCLDNIIIWVEKESGT